ncbi:unnamed protein product [Durusdinium trenchii]|uniref:Uncharacterized protein n=1 Tax=Durusdinium trenchii TaxID=1381693 RepID=A0ABP0RCE1_9DINO
MRKARTEEWRASAYVERTLRERFWLRSMQSKLLVGRQNFGRARSCNKDVRMRTLRIAKHSLKAEEGGMVQHRLETPAFTCLRSTKEAWYQKNLLESIQRGLKDNGCYKSNEDVFKATISERHLFKDMTSPLGLR